MEHTPEPTGERRLEYGSAPTVRRQHPLVLIGVSFALAFVFAVTWVVVMTLTLPETDGVHGQMPFHDPLVFPIMAMVAGVAGGVVCIPTYFALRSYRLWPAVAILAGTVLAEIVFVTPGSPGLGFLGSFGAYACGLVLARRFAGELE